MSRSTPETKSPPGGENESPSGLTDLYKAYHKALKRYEVADAECRRRLMPASLELLRRHDETPHGEKQALYLSVGIFASGLMRDQISALILGVMACLAMNLFGYPFVAAFFDGWQDGLGTLLQRLLGLTAHYQPMLDGLLALGDLTFFVAVSAVFLVLNALWLEGRKY